MANVAIPSLQEVELWFFHSSNPSSGQLQWQASQQLSESVQRAQTLEQYRAPFALVCFQLFCDAERPVEIRFAALTTLSRIQLNDLERQQLRHYLLFQFGTSTTTESDNHGSLLSSSIPAFLRNKVALILTQHILQDVPDRWSTFRNDLQQLALRSNQSQPDLFLKTVETLLEDFLLANNNDDSTHGSGNQTTGNNVRRERASTRRVKDWLKGYAAGEGTIEQQQLAAALHPPASSTNSSSHSPTPLEELFATTSHLLAVSLNTPTQETAIKASAETRQVLALETVQAFFMWTELAFLATTVEQQRSCLELLLVCLQPQRPTSVQLAALKTWGEWTTSASLSSSELSSSIQSAQDPKLPVLSGVLLRLHEYNLLPYTGESEFDIEVVIQVAKLVSQFGLELFPLYEASFSSLEDNNETTSTKGGEDIQALFHKVLDMFFRGFAYDDIDVSLAVLPLASRLAIGMQQAQNENAATSLKQHLPQTLNILFQQLKYPVDFSYDMDEDDNAEEEQYRADLSKLFVKLVTATPDPCLQFVSEAVQQWCASASTVLAPEVEATLRLLFRYAEGIRPTPGVKTVMNKESFCQVLVVLHSSDIANHPHAEVLCWYYETAVRYALFFKQKQPPGCGDNQSQQALLGKLLEAMSGPRGMQHPASPKVRSRCTYLFLKLVKALVSLLRPLVENALQGISTLLSNRELELQPDDTLYLFEAIGLLLGKTGLPPLEQQRYLTMVMTPHVQSIKGVLVNPSMLNDVETCGQSLSYSIAAIAFLSKGFTSKQELSEEIQQIMVEATGIVRDVLQALSVSDPVRNKVMVFLQRMIQSIGPNLLPFMPEFFKHLIAHCTAEDVLFVAQLFNQLCIKFKGDAVAAMDESLMPFLRKCQALAQDIVASSSPTNTPSTTTSNHDAVDPTSIPPHLYTEQLQIQKLAFSVLYHIVTHRATGLLTTASNASQLEAIFITVHEGAVGVVDPVIKKTCLKFFRELLDQWSVEQYAYYYTGLLSFVCQRLLPGMWQCVMEPTFDERDAQQSRNVAELAHILFGIQQRHGLEMVRNSLCASNRWPTSCDPILEAAAAASNAKAFEDCLLQTLKFKTQAPR